MNQKKLPNHALVTLAATLFVSGCTSLDMDTSTKTDATALCCLTCAKPENGCKSVHACRHASQPVQLNPEKCIALGGSLVDQAQNGIK
jgi:hypothetical protein